MVDQFRQRANTQRTKLSKVKGLPKEKNITRKPKTSSLPIRQNTTAAQKQAITFLQLGFVKESKAKQLAKANVESIKKNRQVYNVNEFTSILNQVKGMKKQGKIIPKQIEIYAIEWAKQAEKNKVINKEEKQLIFEKIEQLKRGY